MTTKKQAPLGKTENVKIPSQNLIRDPRAKSSIRGSGQRIPTGDKVTVNGTGAARKQTARWY